MQGAMQVQDAQDAAGTTQERLAKAYDMARRAPKPVKLSTVKSTA